MYVTSYIIVKANERYKIAGDSLGNILYSKVKHNFKFNNRKFTSLVIYHSFFSGNEKEEHVKARKLKETSDGSCHRELTVGLLLVKLPLMNTSTETVLLWKLLHLEPTSFSGLFKSFDFLMISNFVSDNTY
jgi:hypothetical protein